MPMREANACKACGGGGAASAAPRRAPAQYVTLGYIY
jgi:hypothetical protein